MSFFSDIKDLLSIKERGKAVLLLLMIILMACLEALGVASIAPFMTVLSNPETVEQNKILASAYLLLGFESTKSFLFFLGVVFFFLTLVAICIKGFTYWFIFRFTNECNHSISSRLFETYLTKPYSWFLDKNSTNLEKSILTEVDKAVNTVILPFMQIIANGSVAIFLSLLLILIDPLTALVVSLILLVSNVLLFYVVRKYLSAIGRSRLDANRDRFRISGEAFGGIKEVKIFQSESYFTDQFSVAAVRHATYTAKSQIIGFLPRYGFEIIAFGGIILFALFIFQQKGEFNSSIPLVSVFIFAGYRLMPAIQNMYQNLTKVRFGLPIIRELHADFFQDPPAPREGGSPEPLDFNRSVTLKDLTFFYPGTDMPALEGVNIEIESQSTVAFVGCTGSGKTTAVDIILGLLQATSGQLLVDNVPITPENVSSWQTMLGYVPQNIYLSDDAIAANIAFGVPKNKIDMDKVVRASQIADIHPFITEQLPLGYATEAGERGVRLSGGQRQRIGIARALYHDPKCLILDEATSALDNLTEKRVMQSLQELSQVKTIILVAHRLNTVKNCDQIFFFDKGRLVNQGTYLELVQCDSCFREMVSGTKPQ